jgi:hypothetical protein
VRSEKLEERGHGPRTHIFLLPDAGLGHGLDEVAAGEEHDASGHASRLTIRVDLTLDDYASSGNVDLVLKVVEHLSASSILRTSTPIERTDASRRDIVGLRGLPSVDVDPIQPLLACEFAHPQPIFGGGEPGLLIAIVDRREVATDDLVLPSLEWGRGRVVESAPVDIVEGHCEHAHVEQGDGRERSGSDEDEGRLVGVWAPP